MAYEKKPPFGASNIGTLRVKEEIEVRKALDLQLNLELERRRRQAQQNERSLVKVQPNHLAFIEAFPQRKFIYETFPILEPGRQYKDNWHIDAISEILQACTVGEVRNLVINIPRRCMKSMLIAVMWFCWTWTFLPWTRWLFASFSEKFAYRDSNLCRKLIESMYYQSRFGDTFHASLREWKTSKFANDKGGYRACFGVGKGTGEGGDFVIVDDPHQIDEAESAKKIENTINWYFETYYNNVTDPKTACRVIIQQRVGEDDLTGQILARELGYELLCLPMKFEDDHPHKNSVSKPLHVGHVSAVEKANNKTLLVGEEKLFIDPRDPQAPEFDNAWYQSFYEKHFKSRGLKSEGEGQILWQNRFDQPDIDEMVKHLQAYGESAQLQQRPIRRGGNFFQSSLFEIIDGGTIDLNYCTFVRYWDKAGTAGGGDWTVGMLLARSPKRPYTIYIVDIFRKQLGYYERMAEMKDHAEADTRDYVESRIETGYSIGIEKEGASSGTDVATLERDHLLGFDVFIDLPKGKKSHRAKVARSISDAGRIKMFRAPWNLAFIREIEKFDPDKDSQKDDQVDALSGGVRFLIFGHRNDYKSSSGVY